jgi:hypothetical protein
VIGIEMEKFSVKVLLFMVQLLNVTQCKLNSARERRVEVGRVKKVLLLLSLLTF